MIVLLNIGVNTIIESWFRSEHEPFQNGTLLQKFDDDDICRESNPEFHGNKLNTV